MKVTVGDIEQAVKIHGVASTPDGHLVLHGEAYYSAYERVTVRVELSHAEQDMIDALRLPHETPKSVWIFCGFVAGFFMATVLLKALT